MSGLDLTNPRVQRVVQAVALGLGIALAILSIHEGLVWTDGRVYWMAGERVMAGEPLYPPGVDPDTSYRYAPWFAWLWAPLTLLPEWLVAGTWTAAMLVAWGVPVRTFAIGGWSHRAIAALAAPPLLVAALGGNVQPALVALLFLSLARRPGPVAVAVAASLKVFPILFVAVYLGRREWMRATIAVGVGALLWLPMLAFGVSSYPSAVGGPLSLWSISPVVYIGVFAVAAIWALRRHDWPSGSVLVLIGTSVRFIPYHLGYLFCSAPPEADHVPATVGQSQ
jgi:hypothetical protein